MAKKTKKDEKNPVKIKKTTVKDSVTSEYPKLNALKFGLAGGILAGLCVAITTIFGVYGYFLDYNKIILSIYSILGFSLSWPGAILGALYGFIDGFVFTGVFAWLYNKLLT